MYWLGVIGTWLFADGLASLWTYTGHRKDGQEWIRDHSWRIVRAVLGIILIVIGWQG